MALDVPTLRSKTTAELKALRENYAKQRKAIDKTPTTRSVMEPHDFRRCDDAIDMINRIIRDRTRKRKPLAEFR